MTLCQSLSAAETLTKPEWSAGGKNAALITGFVQKRRETERERERGREAGIGKKIANCICRCGGLQHNIKAVVCNSVP